LKTATKLCKHQVLSWLSRPRLCDRPDYNNYERVFTRY